MIVAVLGEKGGTGKTTLAVHLAGWRSSIGKEVLLVDADRQESASIWVSVRDQKGLPSPISIQKYDQGLRRAIMDLSRRYDDTIIDVGSGDIPAIEGVLRVADFAIIPVQPNGMDFWTVGRVDDIASYAQDVNDGLVVKAVLNKASTHPSNKDVDEAMGALQHCELITTSNLVVRERSSIRRSIPDGLLVDEYVPKDMKGISELAAVYQLVYSEPPEIGANQDSGE